MTEEEFHKEYTELFQKENEAKEYIKEYIRSITREAIINGMKKMDSHWYFKYHTFHPFRRIVRIVIGLLIGLLIGILLVILLFIFK